MGWISQAVPRQFFGRAGRVFSAPSSCLSSQKSQPVKRRASSHRVAVDQFRCRSVRTSAWTLHRLASVWSGPWDGSSLLPHDQGLWALLGPKIRPSGPHADPKPRMPTTQATESQPSNRRPEKKLRGWNGRWL